MSDELPYGTDASERDGPRFRVVTVGIVLTAVLVFFPSIKNDFVGWDDGAYITNNPQMESGRGLRDIWTSPKSEQYYPLTFTSYWLEFRLWGRRPAGYHAVNVALHAANCALVIMFLRRLGLSPWGMMLAGVLFALHPVQVMSVAWIAGRKNLLSTLFALLTMLAWHRFRRDGRNRWYVLSLFMFAAALLSKSAVLTLPLVLMAFDRLLLKRLEPLPEPTIAASRRLKPAAQTHHGDRLSWGNTLVRLLPMFVFAGVCWLVTAGFEQKFIVNAPSLAERPLIAAAALLFYVYKLLLPINLAPIYPRWDVSITQWWWYLPILVVAMSALWAWRARKQHSLLVYGLIHFFVFLLPVLGFVAYGNLAVTYVSDHYQYLAMLGVAVILAYAFDECTRTRPRAGRMGGPLCTVVAIVLAILTLRHIPVYRDAESMWTHTLQSNPRCYPAHAGLGKHHATTGDHAGALEHYRQAAAIMPFLSEAQCNHGQALLRANRNEEATNIFRQTLDADARQPCAIYGLAISARRAGQREQAQALFHATIALDPDHVDARLQLAEILLEQGDLSDAAQHCRHALSVAPRRPRVHLGLATCQRRLGRPQQAVNTLRRGLEFARDDTGLLNFLARILATDPDDAVRNGPEAVTLATRACELTTFSHAEALDTMAAAYAETGRFEQAVHTARRAAQLAQQSGREDAARWMLERAGQYERGEPLREIAVGRVAP